MPPYLQDYYSPKTETKHETKGKLWEGNLLQRNIHFWRKYLQLSLENTIICNSQFRKTRRTQPRDQAATTLCSHLCFIVAPHEETSCHPEIPKRGRER